MSVFAQTVNSGTPINKIQCDRKTKVSLLKISKQHTRIGTEVCFRDITITNTEDTNDIKDVENLLQNLSKFTRHLELRTSDKGSVDSFRRLLSHLKKHPSTSVAAHSRHARPHSL